MFLSKIISIFSSPKDVSIDRTKINGMLYEFINSKVIPGTDLSKEEFWKNFVKAANELAPKNRELLKKREEPLSTNGNLTRIDLSIGCCFLNHGQWHDSKNDG